MKRILSILLLICTLLFSCKTDILDVDVSSIDVTEVKILRYDRDFFSMDTANLPASLESIHKKYGDFSRGFVNNVIYHSGSDSLGNDRDLRTFLADYPYKTVFKDYNKGIFKNDFTSLEEDIEDAFRHFKYYFPKRPLPKSVLAVMTGFNYNILQIEGNYGIGLEFYLGPSSIYYEQLEWPVYIRKRCSPEYMAPNFVRAWMLNEFPHNPTYPDLISQMIYEGKILYLQKALLRNAHDSLITGYSQAQLGWCERNEAEMWAAMIEKQKLYSEDE
ncbi:MAG TPA: hypothetical protein VI731_12690, partial [Bacteroidia bacterium]|nr:hypothetical protein [Bacteroidia bacterium]